MTSLPIREVAVLSLMGGQPGDAALAARTLRQSQRLAVDDVRPRVFMQICTNAYRRDIYDHEHPAARRPERYFICDTRDIADVAVLVPTRPNAHVSQAYILTSD